MKSRLQKSSVLPSGEKKSRTVKSTPPPHDFDQLALSAHKLLNDEHLEVSKVRPFFWSLVETYVDRFHIYPFDVSKALFGYLELETCPEDEMQALIYKLEQMREKKKTEVAGITPRLVTKSTVAKSAPKPAVSDLLSINLPSLDDDIADLRACLKYASLVPEI